MKHPLQPGSLSGAVLRSTRRVDGVEVDVHCTRRLPRDAQRNDVDGSTPQLPRHHSRPARRLQASRSAATASTHRVASAAAPRAVETALGRRSRSFTSAPRKPTPARPNGLKFEKETTQRHDSRKRVASTACHRRGTAGRRATTALARRSSPATRNSSPP
uniref:Uncharacterized protein n=1 Tax=Pelagomonas calceolata TaxID=35677 RepID=A0A7S4EA35_9STRA